MKVFSISGYWKDDKTPFNGYKVAELDGVPDGYADDDIFWFGFSESVLNDAIKRREDTVHDFVVTGYELYDDTDKQ